MKRMLFNATQAEELRVAIVDGQKLVDLDIETVGKEQRKSNVYKGTITRIEPSLEACFVDYGTDRHGFLPFKEVTRAYFQNGADGRSRIQDALKEGMELIVQVEKDERGSKGAALTTFISLAGRYLVLMPNNPRGGGVSRRIEGEERQELRATMDQLDVPGGMSIIARTAGIGRSAEELQWDLNYLLQLWRAIESAASSQSGPFLIYQEGSLVIRAIRDYYQPDIGEILIDTEYVFEQARQFMSHVMPGFVNRVKLYNDDVPLFSRFQIEHQIETAFSREVALPSGGAIVIDHTEALVSVDVNSARATKGGDIEETATRTNLEASDEIARQLRLRDLGGLIVVDFIDMEKAGNQREVENRLRDALRLDRARVQTGKISRFGLMELSRQRLQPSLGETAHQPCPRCHGTGFIRGTESSALHILRILQEEAMKENTGAVHAQVPVDVATFLLNEKRADIFSIESRLKVGVVLIPNIHLETPNYSITRLRHDDLNHIEEVLPSYKMMEAPAEQDEGQAKEVEGNRPPQEAAVKGITPAQPAPVVAEKPAPAASAKPSLFQRVVRWFKGEEVDEVKQPTPANKNMRDRNSNRRDGPRRDRNEHEERNTRGERPANERQGEKRRDDTRRDEKRDDGRRNDQARGGGKPRIEEDEQARQQRAEQPRRDRGEQRPTEDREGRAEREPKAPRAEREPKPEREPRAEREPREPRQPRVQAPAANTKPAPTQQELLPVDGISEAAAEAGEGSGRGRRRRGRRGNRGEHAPMPTSNTQGEHGVQELAAHAAQTLTPEQAPSIAAAQVASQPVVAAAQVVAATAAASADIAAPAPAEHATEAAPPLVAVTSEEPPVEPARATSADSATPDRKRTTKPKEPVIAEPVQQAPQRIEATAALADIVAPTVADPPVAEPPVAEPPVAKQPVAKQPVTESAVAESTTTAVATAAPDEPVPALRTGFQQTIPEIGSPEDVGLVQVSTQIKAFDSVDLPVPAPAPRRRRSEVKSHAAARPVQEELVMVETSHTPTEAPTSSGQ